MPGPTTEKSPFGVMLTAMITPFHADGSLDLAGAQRLAAHLVDDLGNDGLVVNGTTGESPTTTDKEKRAVLDAVVTAVGDRASVIAGVGTFSTAHSVELAQQAASVGVDGLLVVTPYYSRPPEDALEDHFVAVADTTDLPVMLYDIPGRTGIPYATSTLLELAEHPNIRAVKDAKGDQWEATKVMAETDLAFYCGSDEVNLPYLALGGAGVVSVVGHVAASHYAAMGQAVRSGDLALANAIHRALVPITEVVMRTSQGAIMAKAAMVELGIIQNATVRLPYVESLPEELDRLRAALAVTPAVADIHA